MNVTRKIKARVDLLEQFDYFEQHGGLVLADRYYAAVQATFDQLAQFPFSGSPYEAISRALEGVRRVPVAGFVSYLIFYVVTDGAVDVIRVLHGARDIEAILLEDFLD